MNNELDVDHTFSIYNINAWQQTSLFLALFSISSIIMGIYFGIENLNLIKYNDYQRTKAKLLVEFNQVGKRKILKLTNNGVTYAHIVDIIWDPIINRGDLFNNVSIKDADSPIFSSKLGKKIYPKEKISYTILISSDFEEKLKKNEIFNITIKWTDYIGNENIYYHQLDFGNESIIGGYFRNTANDPIENLGENLVQSIMELSQDIT